MPNRERILQMKKILENLNTNLTPEDIKGLEELRIIIDNVVRQASDLKSEGDKGAEIPAFDRDGAVEKNTLEQTAKIQLRTAIESFLKYAQKMRERGYTSFFVGGGMYTLWESPSTMAFCGDLRAVENRMEKIKMIGDEIEKKKVIEDGRKFFPEAVAEIEKLLTEYDDWKKIYRQNVRDGAFDMQASFAEMSDRVTEGLMRIKDRLN